MLQSSPRYLGKPGSHRESSHSYATRPRSRAKNASTPRLRSKSRAAFRGVPGSAVSRGSCGLPAVFSFPTASSCARNTKSPSTVIGAARLEPSTIMSKRRRSTVSVWLSLRMSRCGRQPSGVRRSRLFAPKRAIQSRIDREFLMLDTNICIHAIRRNAPEVIRRLERTRPQDVAISGVWPPSCGRA
jgi:hypothetical protein